MTPRTVLSGLAAALIALAPAAALAEAAAVTPAAFSPAAFSPAAAAPAAAPAVERAPAQPESPIDINTASAEELTQLPRVGKVTAERIVAWREENGPFKTTRELINVDGIGERTYELIEPHVTVGSAGGSAASAAAGASPDAAAALAA